jgi:hypothetical protein
MVYKLKVFLDKSAMGGDFVLAEAVSDSSGGEFKYN